MSILPFAPLVHCGFTLAFGLTYRWHPIVDARNIEGLCSAAYISVMVVAFLNIIFVEHFIHRALVRLLSDIVIF